MKVIFTDRNIDHLTPNKEYEVTDNGDTHYQVIDDRGEKIYHNKRFFTKVFEHKEEVKDNINPQHYKQHPSGIECIAVAQHYDYSVGNAFKYLWRAGLKKDYSQEDKDKEIEDLKKAIWYIENKIKMLG